MTYIDNIIANKETCKGEYKINNTIIKVIGIGPKSLKVLVQEPSKFVKTPVWNQTWFKYNDMTDLGKDLVRVMVQSITN